jgi:hypothetical protein
MKRFVAAGVALFCALLSGSAVAQTDEEIADAIAFALHDASFTMYHEIGHMLIGELELPVLGKEEDAADALAVLFLLNDDNDDDSYNALIDAADGWYFNALKSTGSSVDDFSYYSDHSLDIQRAYAMVCLMVGKDPVAFEQAADAYEFSEDQRESCAYTYEQALSSWALLLEPHEVNGETGAEIEVIYDDTEDYADMADILKSSEIMEYAANVVMENYVMPRPFTFRARECGEANAYYSPSEAELTYCYELGEQMFIMYLTDIIEVLEAE